MAPSVAGGETLWDNGHFVGESYVFKPNFNVFLLKTAGIFIVRKLCCASQQVLIFSTSSCLDVG
jgi:hypothetical protein